MPNLTLYQLSEQYQRALETLQDLDLPEEAVRDTLDGLSGELEIKTTNVAMVARHLESFAQAIEDAERRISHRRKVIENRARAIRAYLKENLERSGITKIECPYFKLSIKRNPPSVVVDDLSQIPVGFLRYPEPPPPQADKAAIKEALNGGGTVPGAHLEQATRLSIE